VTLAELVAPERVVVPLRAASLAEAAAQLLTRLEGSGAVQDAEKLRRRVEEERGEDLVALGDRAFLLHYRTDAVRDLLVDRLVPLGLPTILGAPFGHTPRNLAFPFGVPAVLDADAGTLLLREPALL
jgi:hypothetical protein